MKLKAAGWVAASVVGRSSCSRIVRRRWVRAPSRCESWSSRRSPTGSTATSSSSLQRRSLPSRRRLRRGADRQTSDRCRLGSAAHPDRELHRALRHPRYAAAASALQARHAREARHQHSARRSAQGAATRSPMRREAATAEGGPGARDPSVESPIIVDELVADGALLRIIPRRAGKEPKEFAIQSLTMRRLGIGQQMPFVATLTNPIPKGQIETSGTFGPWQKGDPGSTPLGGKYSFRTRISTRSKASAESSTRPATSAESWSGLRVKGEAKHPGLSSRHQPPPGVAYQPLRSGRRRH